MNKQYSKKILNNIFIDKLEIPTCDKYCAILMFQWNQQKSFTDLIKNFLQINVSQLLASLKIIVNNTDQN